MNKKKIKQNIRVDYIYTLFNAMNITSAIWVLYLVHKGMNLIEIGLLEGVFHIASLMGEIPTGALADLLGRKRVIVLGRICSAISAVIFLLSDGFVGFAVAFVFSALSYNLNSGSEEALVYDSLKVLGEEETYVTVNGRINFLIEVGMGIAAFVGGVLADISFDLSYLMATIIAILCLCIAGMFTEVEIRSEEETEKKVSVKEHFIISYDLIRNSKILIFILLYFPSIFAMSAVVFFYAQQNFNLLGFSKTQIAIIFLIHSGFSALGAITSGKIGRFLGRWMKLVLPMLLGVAIIGFSYDLIWLKFLAFCFIGYLTAIMQPLSSNWINENIPSKQRATLISVQSMCFSLMMIILFPLSGVIGEYFSLNTAYLGIGILMMGLAFLGERIFNKISLSTKI